MIPEAKAGAARNVFWRIPVSFTLRHSHAGKIGAALLLGANLHAADPLPGAQPLTAQGDLSAQMAAVSGLAAEFPLQRMVRTARWKLIHYSHLDRDQLFDLTNDPLEIRDLFARPADRNVLNDLRRRLNDWFGPRIAPYLSAADRPDRDN